MNFSYSVLEVNRKIEETLEAIRTSTELYTEQGIKDEDLKAKLEHTQTELAALQQGMSETLAAHSGTYEMVSFLNGALRLEYQNIIDYERYVDAVDDAPLARRLREFSQEEWQHARVLSQKITEMGGEPAFEARHEVLPDRTAYDLLREHYESEKEVIKYYEMGIEKFDDPGFTWLLGKIKVEEEEHLAELGRLLEEYRDTAALVQESKTYRWTDPHMGKPGDRAWIE